MSDFLRFIRDPIWQAVGVLVGIIGIFLAISSPTQSSGELAIIRIQSINFSDYLLPPNILNFNLPESRKNMDGAIVEYYIVINKGPKPIVPSDYTSPLSITHKSGEEILLIDSCTQPDKSIQESNYSSCKPGSFVTSSWLRKDNKWIQEPALLNADERFCVIAIRKNGGQPLNWDGRIIGSKLKSYANIGEYSESLEKWSIYYIQTIIYLDGFSPYWFILLQVSIFYSTLLLARQATWPRVSTSIWPLVMVMLFSTSTSEILIDIFINNNKNLSPVVWPLLVIHACLIIFLLYNAIRNRLTNQNPPIP